MQKIMIIGNCGSGKSTFANTLGKKLDRKVTHLDSLYWKPGWIRTPKEEWEKIQEKLVQNDSWIIDGNYYSTLEIRLQKADTIIFLDFSKWLCLYRAVKRRIYYDKSKRPDLPEQLQEQVSWSLIKWILTYPKEKIIKKIEKYAEGKKVIIFKNPTELDSWLSTFK